MTTAIILAVAEIFGLFMIGAAARRMGYISDEEITRWSRLVMDFLLPPFMFTSIVNGLEAGRLHELWKLPAVGLGMVIFFTLCGVPLLFGLRSRDRELRRTFLHICAVNNSTFLPTVILRNMWGEGALASLFLMYLGGVVGVWTIGVGLLGGATFRERLKKMVSPVLIAIFVAIPAAMAGGKAIIPPLIMNILNRAGGISIPLMLVITGASLAHRGILNLSWQNLYVIVVRLLVLPLLTIPLLYLLPLPGDIRAITVIVALMPSAVSSVVMTRRFGGSTDYAATTAFITTVLSMITAPLGVWLLFK